MDQTSGVAISPAYPGPAFIILAIAASIEA
jgi:hypothetical protein